MTFLLGEFMKKLDFSFKRSVQVFEQSLEPKDFNLKSTVIIKVNKRLIWFFSSPRPNSPSVNLGWGAIPSLKLKAGKNHPFSLFLVKKTGIKRIRMNFNSNTISLNKSLKSKTFTLRF
jgi:hypothetical protein